MTPFKRTPQLTLALALLQLNLGGLYIRPGRKARLQQVLADYAAEIDSDVAATVQRQHSDDLAAIMPAVLSAGREATPISSSSTVVFAPVSTAVPPTLTPTPTATAIPPTTTPTPTSTAVPPAPAPSATATTILDNAPMPVSQNPVVITNAATNVRLGPGPVGWVSAIVVTAQGNMSIVSEFNRAGFALSGMSNGQPYKRVEDELRSWSAVLPQTQDYLLTVAGLFEA